MGGWTLRNGRLIKSSYITHNELQACQLTETKVQQGLLGQVSRLQKSEELKSNYKDCLRIKKKLEWTEQQNIYIFFNEQTHLHPGLCLFF